MSTNSNIAGDGKAIAAHMRNQTKPDEAEHFDLKNRPGDDGEVNIEVDAESLKNLDEKI